MNGQPPELAIRLRGAVKRYGDITAVNGLDLDVPMGTCVGLLGPNSATVWCERDGWSLGVD